MDRLFINNNRLEAKRIEVRMRLPRTHQDGAWGLRLVIENREELDRALGFRITSLNMQQHHFNLVYQQGARLILGRVMVKEMTGVIDGVQVTFVGLGAPAATGSFS